MYKVEKKLNKNGSWVIINKFSNLDSARLYFNNLTNPNYNKFFRLSTSDGKILDDTSNDTHIFFK